MKIDFLDELLKRAPVGSEAERPSHSAKYRRDADKHSLGERQARAG